MSTDSSSSSSSNSSAPDHDVILQYLNDFEPHRYPTGAALQLGPARAHQNSFPDRTRRIWFPHAAQFNGCSLSTGSSSSSGTTMAWSSTMVDRPHHVQGQQRYYQPPSRSYSLGVELSPPGTPGMVVRGRKTRDAYRVPSPLAATVTETYPGTTLASPTRASSPGTREWSPMPDDSATTIEMTKHPNAEAQSPHSPERNSQTDPVPQLDHLLKNPDPDPGGATERARRVHPTWAQPTEEKVQGIRATSPKPDNVNTFSQLPELAFNLKPLTQCPDFVLGNIKVPTAAYAPSTASSATTGSSRRKKIVSAVSKGLGLGQRRVKGAEMALGSASRGDDQNSGHARLNSEA